MPRERGLSLPAIGRLALLNYAVSGMLALFGVSRQVPGWLSTLVFGTFITLGVVAMSWTIPRMRVPSFFGTVLLQVIAITVCMGGAFVSALLTCVAFVVGVHPFQADFWDLSAQILGSGPALFSMAMFMAITFVISMTLQISRKLGPGVLWNWVTGKYHQPQEEERIFMFLDLRDSTTHAERLGAVRFSALVRDCFADLSLPCEKTGAQVSHYIGDEAVISWTTKRGLKSANCLRLFHFFEDEIRAHEAVYRRLYGFVPEFKAGAHIGPVVSTEVGDAKSEIVFHGDVVNTTARIQGLCNESGAKLLVSKILSERIGPAMAQYRSNSLGLQVLKGRLEPVEVIRVDRFEN